MRGRGYAKKHLAIKQSNYEHTGFAMLRGADGPPVNAASHSLSGPTGLKESPDVDLPSPVRLSGKL